MTFELHLFTEDILTRGSRKSTRVNDNIHYGPIPFMPVWQLHGDSGMA